MARRRSSNRRRRRGRFGFLYKILSVLAICAVIVVALTLFFKVDTVQVTGGDRYTKQEIVNASGIKIGDNLFLLNKFDMAERILKKLPYIEKVRMNRKLPDTMVIDVKECSSAFAVEKGDTAWLISPSGKIVDSRKLADAKGVPTIDGCQLTAPSVGSAMDMTTKRESQRTSLLRLMSAIQSAGVTDQVNAIHLKSTSELVMDYAGRFSVKMPYNANYPHLVKYLRAVIKQLESNETGTIDLMTDGEAHVLPAS